MKGSPHSPKLQHYWNLNIRLLSVISRTLVEGGVLHLSREAVSVFYSPSPMGKLASKSSGLLLMSSVLTGCSLLLFLCHIKLKLVNDGVDYSISIFVSYSFHNQLENHLLVKFNHVPILLLS